MHWAYTPMHVSSGSNGGLHGMLWLFSDSAPLFHYRDGTPFTAKFFHLTFLPTPDRSMWLRCSQIQSTQFAYWCCHHCCQGRPPFRHYSEADQMEKLNIQDINPSPRHTHQTPKTMAAAQQRILLVCTMST